MKMKKEAAEEGKGDKVEKERWRNWGIAESNNGWTKIQGDRQEKGQGTSNEMREIERVSAGRLERKKEAGKRRKELDQLPGE